MELNAEWQKFSNEEYSDNADEQVGFRDGATAYKQAVEALLKDKYNEVYNSGLINVEDASIYLAQSQIITNFLTELKTLKPTSND